MASSVSCSFCGKSNKAVFLVIFSGSAFICDECVEICQVMVAVERLKRPRKKRWPAVEECGISINGRPAAAEDVIALGHRMDAEDGGYPAPGGAHR